MLLIVVHGVQLLAQLLLHGVQIAGGGDVYQHGGARGVAALIVHAERIQQHIALVVQRQGGLAALVRHGIGIHTHIARGGGLGALRRVAAVDRRARHGAGACGTEEGQCRFRRDADGEGLARLHLHGGGNGAVAEIVRDISQVCRIGTCTAGIFDLLGIHPHQRQFVSIVQLDSRKSAGLLVITQIIIAAAAKGPVHQLTVQEHQRRSAVVRILQQTLTAQQVIGAGVGVQRHGGGIGVGVVRGRPADAVKIDVRGIQHGYVHADLRRGGGGQAVDGSAQIAQGRREQIAFSRAHVGGRHAVRQRQSRRSGIPQGLNTLGGVTRQRVRIIFFCQIPDGLQLQLCDTLALVASLFCQRLAGRLHLRRQRLNLGLLFGLVVVGGVALGVEHRGHQGLRLVAGCLIGRPGLGGIVLRAGSVLQFLVQQCGVGPVSGDQLGNGGSEISAHFIKCFLTAGAFQNLLRLCENAACRESIPVALRLVGLAVPLVRAVCWFVILRRIAHHRIDQRLQRCLILVCDGFTGRCADLDNNNRCFTSVIVFIRRNHKSGDVRRGKRKALVKCHSGKIFRVKRGRRRIDEFFV